ncbi:MAG: LD-carboxypeptidase [Clostridia bacterium]|nr:LD-carboxypeptidase [Clostridia bacterium]
MNYPKALKPGMTIGIISPSGARNNDVVLPRMKKFWEDRGYKTVIGKSCTSKHGHLAGTDEVRANDINQFFADDAIDAIFCTRGGYGAARLMSLIDYDTIRKHPKIFVGYSDITALHTAFNRYGQLITFHGPNGEITVDDDNTPISMNSLMQALTASEGYELVNPEGYPRTTLQGGIARGALTGGNLTLVTHSLGTPWAPDFAGKILFLEDVDEHTYRVDEMLVNLKQAGAFDQCAGILLGEFTDCNIEYPEYGQTLEQIFDEVGFPKNKPILRGIRVGHCNPKLTLPLGAMCEMDADRQTVRILEAPVK